ncbi:MAG: hypothetical protein NVSMB23_27510 [Myxococcales bacterium]
MPTSFIEHRGVPLVLMDFHGIGDREQALAEIAAAARFVAQQPRRRDLRVLADVKDSKWDAEILEAVRKLIAHNRPWVFASAVVGVDSFARVTIRALLLLSHRQITLMSDLAAAKDWLLAQPGPAQAHDPP